MGGMGAGMVSESGGEDGREGLRASSAHRFRRRAHGRAPPSWPPAAEWVDVMRANEN